MRRIAHITYANLLNGKTAKQKDDKNRDGEEWNSV